VELGYPGGRRMKKGMNNKGISLIELISAIAILSIVAFASFTLLIFSVRSNNWIVTGAAAAQDADLLNKRLEVCFQTASFPSKTDDCEIALSEVSFADDKQLQYEEGVLSLVGENDSSELLQDNLQAFQIVKIENKSLIRVSYSIGNRRFSRLFRVNLIAETE
jgi:hypothetical protein